MQHGSNPLVGWVERRETHRIPPPKVMGIAALSPSYALVFDPDASVLIYASMDDRFAACLLLVVAGGAVLDDAILREPTLIQAAPAHEWDRASIMSPWAPHGNEIFHSVMPVREPDNLTVATTAINTGLLYLRSYL